jgi:hypothetical protein
MDLAVSISSKKKPGGAASIQEKSNSSFLVDEDFNLSDDELHHCLMKHNKSPSR